MTNIQLGFTAATTSVAAIVFLIALFEEFSKRRNAQKELAHKKEVVTNLEIVRDSARASADTLRAGLEAAEHQLHLRMEDLTLARQERDVAEKLAHENEERAVRVALELVDTAKERDTFRARLANRESQVRNYDNLLEQKNREITDLNTALMRFHRNRGAKGRFVKDQINRKEFLRR